MTGESSYGTGRINFYAGVLWVWTVVVIVASGVLASFAYSTVDYVTGATQPNGTALLGGMIGGAFSTLPLWALFGLGAHLARRSHEARAEARNSTEAITSAVESLRSELATFAAPFSSPGEQTASQSATPEEPEQSVGPIDDPILVGPYTPAVLGQLLSDPMVGQQAAKTRQIYGRKVAAAFLARKAREAGYADAVVTEADLPQDF